ncbi:MAG TPA: fumarylacetoacetate hydrolase, partial [Arthrobacter bacterium]|nr:fumarylacetoacetate hydrolase [Arthrobacter sp.]
MSAALDLGGASVLPDDAARALLIGRVWDVETGGPRVVAVQEDDVFDLQQLAGTVSELLERPDLAAAVRTAMTLPRWKTS